MQVNDGRVSVGLQVLGITFSESPTHRRTSSDETRLIRVLQVFCFIKIKQACFYSL